MKQKFLSGLLLLLSAAILFVVITSFAKREKNRQPVPAVVYTKAVNNITSTTATCSYRIQVTNVSQAKQIGVVVAKGPGATVKTTNLNFYTTYGIKALGDYVMNLKGLDPGISLYARAYVKVDTTYVYGNAVAFKTLPQQKPVK